MRPCNISGNRHTWWWCVERDWWWEEPWTRRKKENQHWLHNLFCLDNRRVNFFCHLTTIDPSLTIAMRSDNWFQHWVRASNNKCLCLLFFKIVWYGQTQLDTIFTFVTTVQIPIYAAGRCCPSLADSRPKRPLDELGAWYQEEKPALHQLQQRVDLDHCLTWSHCNVLVSEFDVSTRTDSPIRPSQDISLESPQNATGTLLFLHDIEIPFLYLSRTMT